MIKQSTPTVRFCKNGTIIIRGVSPSEFRSILTQASLYQYDEQDKHGRFGKEPEFNAIDERLGLKDVKLRNWAWDYAWRERMRYIVDCLSGDELRMKSNRMMRSWHLKEFFARFRELAAQVGASIRPEDL